MSFRPGNSQNSKQSLKSQQKLVQDTNYDNHMFYGILSVVESLILYYQNRHNSQNFKDKMFANYDRIDYHSKSLQELKSQLNVQLNVFLVSRRMFIE